MQAESPQKDFRSDQGLRGWLRTREPQVSHTTWRGAVGSWPSCALGGEPVWGSEGGNLSTHRNQGYSTGKKPQRARNLLAAQTGSGRAG